MAKQPRRDRYLITLQTLDGIAFHGYLLTAQKQNLDAAIEIMARKAEQIGLRHLNLWMSTGPLTPQPDIEALIRKHCPEGGKTVDAYKGGTFTTFVVWAMRDDDPDNETLMQVH